MIYDDKGFQLMERDPLTGRTVWRKEEDDKILFRTDYPVDAILDDNEERFNASLNDRYGDGKIVASIPIGFYFAKLAEPIREGDQKYVKRILNDREYVKFRTFGGHI
ncbi:MAG: hypothetical protein HRT36_02695 [Alphaproteobacteria bacterium]|nr:hypothetical protein [Alphaproteobacteria bacterium]